MVRPRAAWLNPCFLGALALLSLLGSPSSASAELIGVASSAGPGAIYSINPATGAATLLTNTPGTSPTINGAEFRQGVLYVSDVVNERAATVFGTYDLKTGAFTQVSDQGGFTNLQGLAYRPGNDLFYSVDNRVGNPLVTINPLTGVVTTIADTNAFVRGMAFDQTSDILYGVTGLGGPGDLVTINPLTGAVTTIGSTGQAIALFAGLAFDENNRILYMNLGSGGPTPNSLFRINTATGAATLVGGNGAVAGFGIDGLAWRPGIGAVPVPEPSSLALTGLGMLGVLGWVRRRKKASG